ncbi:MAG: chromate transporter [Bacteroidales bacterium]|nr:chromate transporter [Bacteroidales bacterium]
MLFLQLILTFLLIGAFTFGGGYSMIALIQDQVVVRHQWVSPTDFADILAISQLTPGPVGINAATFTGYTAVLNAGHSQPLAVLAAVAASLAVLAVPLLLILLVGRWLIAHQGHPLLATLFPVLRLTVVGLIAAAAVSLMPAAFAPPSPNSPLPAHTQLFSFLVFAVVLALSLVPRRRLRAGRLNLAFLSSPITLILLSALAGILVYGL